jgi:tripartite-type tricarboxylate transporter receptor subunit TctC
LIVPYPPGGPTDLIGRLTSATCSRSACAERRGRQSRRRRDGDRRRDGSAFAGGRLYLLVSSETTFAVNPALTSKLLTIPSAISRRYRCLPRNHVLAVTLSLPVNSVSQLVAYAKANPGKLSYGSAGAGGANHLAGEMFKHVAGIDMVHVPYKGNGPAIIDLIGGQIGVMIGSISSLYPHETAKKLRCSPSRDHGRPPHRDSDFRRGRVPGYRVNGWNCLAPRAAPQPVIKRLNAVVAGFSQPDVVERLRKRQHRSRCGTPIAAYMKSEIALSPVDQGSRQAE